MLTLEEFSKDLELNDTTVEEFLDEFKAEIVELFETSSAEVFVFGRKYLFEVTVKEIK